MSVKIQPSGFTRNSSGDSGGGNLFSRPSSGINIQQLGPGVAISPGGVLSAPSATIILTGDVVGSGPDTGPITISISDSVNLPGNPTTTTQSPGDNSTLIATDAFVQAAIIAALATIFPWYEVTGPLTMAINSGYVANNSSQVVLTLPVTAPFGSIVRVVNKGAGGWQIAQNAGQVIHFGNQDTTSGTGGSLQSQSNFDVVELLCTTSNTNWTQLAAQGNITVV